MTDTTSPEARSGHIPLLITLGIVAVLAGVILLIVGSVHYGSYAGQADSDSGIVQMFWGAVVTGIGASALLIALGVAAVRWKAPVPIELAPGQRPLPDLKDDV